MQRLFLSILIMITCGGCCWLLTCDANVIDDAKKTAEKAKDDIKHAADKADTAIKEEGQDWKKHLDEAKEKAKKDLMFYSFAIIKPYLFLGGYFSLNKEHIENHGITASLNLAHPLGKRKVIEKYQLDYKSYPVNDLPTDNLGYWFQDATSWIEAERQKFGGKGRIWVNCAGGISRSASVVVAYLIRYDERKWTADQYIADINEHHRKIHINFGFKKQLLEWEQRVRSFDPNERHKTTQGQEKIAARPVAPLNMDENDK